MFAYFPESDRQLTSHSKSQLVKSYLHRLQLGK